MRVCFAAALLVTAGPARAAHPITITDLLAEQHISQPAISPDGTEILYRTETADLAADSNTSHIWLASWNGQHETLLTTRPKESVSRPKWSADGAFITFLSDRDGPEGISQLWRLPRAGGEAEKLTSLPGGLDDYAVSPDNRHLALIAEDPGPDEGRPADAPPKPIVIDRFRFKQDIDGYLTTAHAHLTLFDLASRTATKLIEGDTDEALPAFSPDGRQIAFVSKRHKDADRDDNTAIFLIGAAAGANPRALTHFDGGDASPDWDSPPAWSPDGRQIAYVHGGNPKFIEYAVHSLAIIPSGGGEPKFLTAALDRNVTHPAFSPDGKSIRFLIEDDRAAMLAAIPASGGKITTLAGGRRVILDFSEGRNGNIALLSGHPETPTEIAGLDAKGEHVVSHRNDAWRANLQFATEREIAFPSADGTDIHGFLLTPPGYRSGTPAPTILRIHGGPQAQLDCRFDNDLEYDLPPQVLAAHGYVVLAVNPRGSTGRGEKFAMGIYADWGNKDAQDVLAAVDWAVRGHIADPAHLGVGGWSYGGMLTNYVIAQDHRFRAATSGASISNILAGYGTDEYVRDYEAELGTPWSNTAGWERISFPFLHADRITTPTLFMGGTKDFNVPLLNQEQMYQALRSRGLRTRLIIYPGAFHNLTRPSYIIDRTNRDLAWYDGLVR
jgi:dipeptidyl aminopeptidase/acylaminoacyl peptidase